MAEKSKGAIATLAVILAVIAGMLILTAVSPILYRLFCDITGYGGTTRVAEQAPGAPENARVMTIRFDANIDNALPWEFRAPKPIKVKVGEQALINYSSRSLTEQESWGSASYNVLPESAGIYFNKIDCFCFTEQKLAPGEQVDMPVTFFVDPEIDKDPYLKAIDTITLSYYFYPIDAPKDAPEQEPAGQ